MIPKKIHYVWVGGNPKPEKIKKCMETWKLLEDEGFEIIEWNENNFDIDAHLFAKTAYEQKKWAFVSDFIRAYVIYHHGGIYLDTDVVVCKSLLPFLNNRAFVGFETDEHPFTAAFGAEKGHPMLKDMLDLFAEKAFSIDPANPFKEVNTVTVSNLLIDKYACELGNKEQTLPEDIKVYPKEILCDPSLKSVTVHVFTRTWLDDKKSLIRRLTTHLRIRSNNWFAVRLLLMIRWVGSKVKG